MQMAIPRQLSFFKHFLTRNAGVLCHQSLKKNDLLGIFMRAGLCSQAQPKEFNHGIEAEVAVETKSDTRDESLQHEDFFGLQSLFTRRDLFEARVHLGHKEGLLDPRMKKYLMGTRREQCIIDLDQTVPLLRSALNFTAHMAHRSGIILFVSRTPQFAHDVEEMARQCGEYAHTRRWQKGCFTNAQIQMGPGTRLPDLLVFFNTLNDVFAQHQAVVDAAKMNIPTVAVVDSNCNPNLITYPVPGNDDTPSAMELYIRLFKEAVLLGKQKRKEQESSPV
ncbi:small ribosomal subunit protein uS2m-like [Diadema antillarum]|uniref:small ribosomal subunit protein uS2m-like n=1 Tax=Diadema antillarum TaxID=105358 RepID=UPI003A8A072A